MGKTEIESRLAEILAKGNNNCFQCGKEGNHHAEIRHAIFLCRGCAHAYEQNIANMVTITNIHGRMWSEEEL